MKQKSAQPPVFFSIVKYSASPPKHERDLSSWKVFSESIRQKEEEHFVAIKTTIEKNPAYQDKSANIEITENRINFRMSPAEVKLVFPELIKVLKARNFLPCNKSFSAKNIHEYWSGLHKGLLLSVFKEAVAQPELIKEAEAYFKQKAQVKKSIVLDCSNENQLFSPETLLFNILKENSYLIIAELHNESASKKILIDNFAELKAKGVTHLFIEHLLADTQMHLLEQYFASPSSESMPHALRVYLASLDESFYVKSSSYNFTQLIVSAKQHGIKVVPIDTSVSYILLNASESNKKNRILMMNYVAEQQFEKYKKEDFSLNKAIVFCGIDHAKELQDGVPGLSEITGSPVVFVRDTEKGEQEVIMVSPESYTGNPDIVIKMDPKKTVAYSSSNTTSNKEDEKISSSSDVVSLNINEETQSTFIIADQATTNEVSIPVAIEDASSRILKSDRYIHQEKTEIIENNQTTHVSASINGDQTTLTAHTNINTDTVEIKNPNVVLEPMNSVKQQSLETLDHNNQVNSESKSSSSLLNYLLIIGGIALIIAGACLMILQPPLWLLGLLPFAVGCGLFVKGNLQLLDKEKTSEERDGEVSIQKINEEIEPNQKMNQFSGPVFPVVEAAPASEKPYKTDSSLSHTINR